MQKVREARKRLLDKINEIMFENSEWLSLNLKLGDVDLLFENSPVFGSTSFGFLFEAYALSFLLKDESFVNPKNVVNSSFDLIYNDPNGIRFLINLKVNKITSNNDAFAAHNRFINDFITTDSKTYFMVIKFYYFFSENKVKISSNLDSFIVEEYYHNEIKLDKRSWSGTSDPLAGRIQFKKAELKKQKNPSLQKGFTRDEIIKFIKENLSMMVEHKLDPKNQEKLDKRIEEYNKKIKILKKIEYE